MRDSSLRNQQTVKVFDILGNVVFADFNFNANCKLQTANWQDGIYFVQVKSGARVANAKVVVRH